MAPAVRGCGASFADEAETAKTRAGTAADACGLVADQLGVAQAAPGDAEAGDAPPAIVLPQPVVNAIITAVTVRFPGLLQGGPPPPPPPPPEGQPPVAQPLPKQFMATLAAQLKSGFKLHTITKRAKGRNPDLVISGAVEVEPYKSFVNALQEAEQQHGAAITDKELYKRGKEVQSELLNFFSQAARDGLPPEFLGAEAE